MEQLIQDIYEIIGDYRSDEDNPHVQITTNRILRWIMQFDETDRIFLLTELKNIFNKYYLSKLDVKECLKESIEFITQYYEYPNINEFLLETVFLDLQPQNKSQPVLLQLMRQVLQEEFQFNFNECGRKLKKNFIYLDDVLCTGNTLFQDIKVWVQEKINGEQTYLTELQSNNIRLVFSYFIIHSKNCRKKFAQFRYQIAQDFNNCYILIRKFEIENSVGSKLQIILPTNENQPEIVCNYQQEIEENVKNYCLKRNIPLSNDEYFRPNNIPQTEEFFTNSINRKRFEDIIFHKGIQILNASGTTIPNLRALGYSLPSLRDFGFGTLCFTWRNVPNNTPIVFWYSGGGFFPLFVKH
ncbi:MAG: hypothetical protein JXB49_07865 [Bacteroidales bacterium]|nr:hypothetical protein [Bacteroidales bacterium]